MGASQTYTVKKQTVIGDVRLVMGTYTNAGGSTGGAIVTGLNEVFYFESNYMASEAEKVNKAVILGGTVTLTTEDGEDGQWLAIGV